MHRTFPPGILVAGALLLAAQAWSQPRLISSSPALDLGSGASFVIKKVGGAKEFEFKLVFFDSEKCAVHVAANTERNLARSLEITAREAKAIAACNGGYFNQKFGPIGLEIAAGSRTGTYDHQNLPFGGALVVDEKSIRILRDDEFTDGTGITELIQCCPRLMEGGAVVKGVGGEERAPRTFVLTDCAGHWALGVSNGIGLQELADTLATPGIIVEFKVQRALNLDGGPSSGLWYRAAEGTPHYQHEAWPIRNIILVTPRKK